MLKRRRQGGFTLIELLIVVAIIGIIAAIAIPNLLNAIDRGKQKRTMADIRSIGTAVESYSIDNNFYPKSISSAADLDGHLEPVYIKAMPERDGWGANFVVATASDGEDYTVGSGGKDKSTTLSACTGAPQCQNFDDDIIFVNGQFTQWPEGTQR